MTTPPDITCPQCKQESVRLVVRTNKRGFDVCEYYACRRNTCAWSDMNWETGYHDKAELERLRKLNPGLTL